MSKEDEKQSWQAELRHYVGHPGDDIIELCAVMMIGNPRSDKHLMVRGSDLSDNVLLVKEDGGYVTWVPLNNIYAIHMLLLSVKPGQHVELSVDEWAEPMYRCPWVKIELRIKDRV